MFFVIEILVGTKVAMGLAINTGEAVGTFVITTISAELDDGICVGSMLGLLKVSVGYCDGDFEYEFVLGYTDGGEVTTVISGKIELGSLLSSTTVDGLNVVACCEEGASEAVGMLGYSVGSEVMITRDDGASVTSTSMLGEGTVLLLLSLLSFLGTE